MLQDWEFAYIAANGDYYDMENFVFNRSAIDIKDMTKEQLLEQVNINYVFSILHVVSIIHIHTTPISPEFTADNNANKILELCSY